MAAVRKRLWTYKGEPRSKWVVSYTDLRGKRREKYFSRKRDADACRAEVEVALKNHTHESAGGSDAVRMREIINLYLKSIDQRVNEGRLGRSSAQNIRISLIKHLAPVFENRRVKRITTLDVEQWHGELLKTLHPTTARSVLYRVAAMELYAQKRGISQNTAFRDYCAEVKGIKAEPIRNFTTEQVRHLLRVAEVRPDHGMYSAHLRLRCFVHVAVFCGLRFGEIAGLTRSSLDLTNGLVHVRHNLTQLDELKSPKTRAGVRDVPAPPHLVDMLREWLMKHFVCNDRDLVFLTRSRQGFRPSLFLDSWRALLGRAGLLDRKGRNQFHFHALRHFYASSLIEHHLPMPEVASLLGHKKFDTTLQIYAHPIVGGNRRHSVVQGFAATMLAPVSENTFNTAS